MKEFPLVTFVSPCYNHAQYVIESLESIRKQTYPNIQHIIIDDCSKDDSVAKIEAWIEEHEYPCEFIKHSANRGISYTLNESILLAKGEFWTPLATDDVSVPERTELLCSFLLAHPETNMVTSDTTMIDEQGKAVFLNGTSSFIKHYQQFNPKFDWSSFGTFPSLLFGNYIPGSLMFRKSIFDEVGFFPEAMKLEDWDTWLRISRKSPIGLIEKPLTYYRWHPSNSVANRNSFRRNILQTFGNQREYCYKSGKKSLYKEAYLHHFNGFFSPKHFDLLPQLIALGGLRLVTTAFSRKIRKWLRLKAPKFIGN